MFFLGILATQQVLILPGLILTKAIKFKTRFICHLMAIICSSLVINYLLVFFLTALHLFTKITLLILLCLEVIAILWLYRIAITSSLDSILIRVRKSYN